MFSDLMVVFNIICYWFYQKVIFPKVCDDKKKHTIFLHVILLSGYHIFCCCCSTGIVYGFFSVYGFYSTRIVNGFFLVYGFT